MPYSIDKQRAVALEISGGLWSMEVEELVRLNRNTFRPRRRRLSGKDSILQHLAVNEGHMLQPTQNVLESFDGLEDALRFQVRDNGWVPAPAAEEVVSPERARELMAASFAEEFEKLHRRIGDLEQLIRSLSEKLMSGSIAIAAPTAAAPAPTATPALSAPEAAPAAAATAAAAPAAVAAQTPAAAPSEAAAGEAAPSWDPLKVPSSDAVLDLVRGLVGEHVNMSKGDPSSWALSGPVQGYLSLLTADDGEAMGALIMDLEATIRLAGGMLMEDEESLDAQVEDKTPSDDVIDAAGEVLNTLTSAVNKTKGNKHVRAGKLEPVAEFEKAWLHQPRGREDFTFSIGGRLVFVSR